MASDPKAIWQRYLDEVWNQGKMEVIDELIAEDFWDHTPMGEQERGREGIRWFVSNTRSAFPDVKGRIEKIVSSDDYVAVYLVFEGTHTGEFMGLQPTGKRIELIGVDILKVENGQLAHSWANFDIVGLMAQLGALGPPPGQEAAAGAPASS